MLALVGAIGEIITRRRAVQRPETPLVFYRIQHGKVWPVERFAKAWRTVRAQAGLSEARIFHDFRRTSVRNMTQAGVLEKVEMPSAGHKPVPFLTTITSPMQRISDRANAKPSII